MRYLMELDGWNDENSPPGVETERFASTGYNTEPDDSPANVHFEGRLKVPANYKRSLFGTGSTFGRASVGYGEAVLVNADGGLDYMRARAFDRRRLEIWTLADGSPFADRLPYFYGTVEQPTYGNKTLSLRIRDRLAELQDAKIQTTLYAGTTTSGGSTAEGNADFAGRPKPRLWGKVRNITPAICNAYDLIFQVNDGAVQSIDAVYSNGAPVTDSLADYASLAALQAATITSGQFATCKALGLFRLGGAPAGLVTADVTQGANAAARTAAQIAKSILTGPAGLSGADYDNATFTALDTKNSAVCGIYVDAERSILEVVSEVLSSIGAWIAPTRLGVFQVGRFEAPDPSNVADTYTKAEILDRGQGLQRLPTGDDGRGVPAWRVIVRYARNYTPLSAGQLAGSVNSATASFFNNEWRQSVASDATVQTKHPSAPTLTFDSCLAEKADADAEVARRLALYSAESDRYLVPMKSDYAVGRNMGDTVEIQWDRYGMNAGRNFVIIGIAENAETGISELDVWG